MLMLGARRVHIHQRALTEAITVARTSVLMLDARRVHRMLVAVIPGGSWPPNSGATAAAEAMGFM